MKKSAMLFLVMILLSCNYNELSDDEEGLEPIDSSEFISVEPFNLEGSWVLTSYLDSIIVNKEIAKYRLQAPSWLGIMLLVQYDSIKNFGSITDGVSKRMAGDTIAFIDGVNSKWKLTKADTTLELTMVEGLGTWDSTIYIYEKRDKLSYLHDDVSSGWPLTLDNSLTDYFNETLLKGEYINAVSKDTVRFTKDGSIFGLADYTSFEAWNYFGTSHNFKQLDVVKLMAGKRTDFWSFKIDDDDDDEMHLVELKGDWYGCDCYVPTKNKIHLKKNIYD